MAFPDHDWPVDFGHVLPLFYQNASTVIDSENCSHNLDHNDDRPTNARTLPAPHDWSFDGPPSQLLTEDLSWVATTELPLLREADMQLNYETTVEAHDALFDQDIIDEASGWRVSNPLAINENNHYASLYDLSDDRGATFDGELQPLCVSEPSTDALPLVDANLGRQASIPPPGSLVLQDNHLKEAEISDIHDATDQWESKDLDHQTLFNGPLTRTKTATEKKRHGSEATEHRQFNRQKVSPASTTPSCKPNMWNPQGPCRRCYALRNRNLLGELLCQRHRIEDASLFRDQKTPWPGFTIRFNSMELEDNIEWEAPEIRTVQVSHGFGNIKFNLYVRRFVPTADDTLEKTWLDGSRVKHHHVPPYAICDYASAMKELRNYIRYGMGDFISSTFDGSDTLWWYMLKLAVWWCNKCPTAEEKTVLSNALRLWVAAQMTCHPESICGDQWFGTTVRDDTSPYNGTVPVSPVMCAQLELLSYSGLLHPYRRQILEGLISILRTNPRDRWFTLYLTAFVLLHSCSNVSRRDHAFARQMGLRNRWANPDSIVDHHIGAQTVLFYFHHYCKSKLLRAATEGIQNEKQFAKAQASIPRLSHLIQQTAVQIKTKHNHIESIRANRQFGDNYYFISQLFDPDDRPAPIARADDTFIRSYGTLDQPSTQL